MQTQLNHAEFKQIQKKHKNPIMFILENLEHMENIGSAFRLADGFNIEGVIIITNEELSLQKIQKTARNCEKNIPYVVVSNCVEALKIVENKGYVPLNLEITSTSKPLREYSFEGKKIALVVGNEKHGISEEMLDLVPNSTHIEMYGNNSSLNVATALSIATYHISEEIIKKKFKGGIEYEFTIL